MAVRHLGGITTARGSMTQSWACGTRRIHYPNGELGATLSNPELSQDVNSLQNSKPQLPNASFIILYRIVDQVKPEEYDYTHNYKP